MRLLTAITFLGIASSFTTAADKDADKAKEVSLAFLKAVKGKDLDAVMKTVDTPFVFDFGVASPQTIDKPDDLKAAMKTLLENVTPDKIPTEVVTAHDMTAFTKLAKEKDEAGMAEKAVALVGKTGYAVTMKGKDGREFGGALVRIKGGKAFVAAIPK